MDIAGGAELLDYYTEANLLCNYIFDLFVMWNIPFILTLPLICWLDMGVERCVSLGGLTEAQIDKKLEDLAKAG